MNNRHKEAAIPTEAAMNNLSNPRVFKKTRKLMLMILSITTLLFLFTACSKDEVHTTVDINKVAVDLKDQIKYSDDLVELDDSMISNIYNIPPENVVVKKVYASSGATAEEIAVFEAKDENSVESIELAIKTRVQNQIESFEDYISGEIPKLKDPIIYINGKYIVVCISNDNDKANKIIESYFKK